MRPPSRPLVRPRRLLAALAAGLAFALPAAAERADRDKPMEIVADRSSTVDFVNQVSRFTGNVVVTQGTMTLRAERVEVRETKDGYRSGTAWGSPQAQVRYRQKRDGVDEYVEGIADRVELDGKAETLRFVGNAVVRRNGADNRTIDEISGDLITWNHTAELFSVQGGAPTAGNPGGRVRAVLSPRPSGGDGAASRPGR